MNITRHGNKVDPFYKGVAKHVVRELRNGEDVFETRRLVFFGWSPEHVTRKELEWLGKNSSVGKARPALRLVKGGAA